MTSKLFFGCLQRFNSYVQHKIGTKVLLLIDNCSAHGTNATVPELRYVQVKFLPPNTTSKIQPCDAGIIASLKSGFRHRQMKRVLDLIDVDPKKMYNIDQLTAMQWIRELREEMDPKTISNSWNHTGLLRASYSSIMSVTNLLASSASEIGRNIASAIPESSNRISISAFLNPDGEDDVFEVVNDSSLLSSVFL